MSAVSATILGVSGPRLTRAERDFLTQAQPWGLFLFARNIEDPEQVSWLTTELREALGRDAPIFIDQEGGRVARMRGPHWREWLPPLDQVRHNPREAVRSMYLRYRIIADELRRVGIDGNAAPVGDLLRPDTHPVLANRCYGDDVVKVAEIAGAVATGLVDGGVLPIVKHMPGHGRATVDSHLDLPRVKAERKALRVSDFLAFEAVSGLPIGMTAHVVFEDIDPDHPATQSETMVTLIRETIRFAGLLVTDDLSMQALAGSLTDRVAASRVAGVDMMLHCNGNLAEMEEVVAAAGALDGPAANRADAALKWRELGEDVDIEAAEAEFHALMTGRK